MYLQKLIESSISRSNLSPSSRLYKTKVDKSKLWRTYLKFSPVLNACRDENHTHYDCSTCRGVIESIGTAVYLDNVLDDAGQNTGQVELKSLLWNPDLTGVEDDIKDAIAELNELVLDDRKIASVKSTAGVAMYGKKLAGTDSDGNPFDHLHVKDLPMALLNPSLELHPSNVEQRISGLNRQLQIFTDMDAVVKELKRLDASDSSMTQKAAAFMNFMGLLGEDPVTNNHVKWLTASNPAAVVACKFHTTPLGIYLIAVLNGKDRDVELKLLEERYSGEKYMRTTDTKPDNTEANRKALEYADKVLQEHGLTSSLDRTIVSTDYLLDLPAIWNSEELEKPVVSGMKSVLAEEPEVVDVVSNNISWGTLLELLPDIATLEVELVSGYCALCMVSKQVDETAPSLYKNGMLSNFSYGHTELSNSMFGLGSHYVKLGNLIDMNGTYSFTLDKGNSVNLKTPELNMPIFASECVPEVHGIRKQIEQYAASKVIPVDTVNTGVVYAMLNGIFDLHPRFRYVLKSDPSTRYAVKVVIK